MHVNKHEDYRRIVIEWIDDYPIRSCKAIVAKEDTILGNHYHNKKEDIFYLLKGKCDYKLGKGEFKPLKDVLVVPKKVRHWLRLKKGTIILEGSTKPFNFNDEIK